LDFLWVCRHFFFSDYASGMPLGCSQKHICFSLPPMYEAIEVQTPSSNALNVPSMTYYISEYHQRTPT